jgi:hypothetical protein
VLDDVDRLFGQAERARLLGEPARALELLQEVLEYDAMHVPARLSLARAAAALGRDGLSLYYAASALDLQQGHGPFYLARERGSLPTSILGLQGLLVDFTAELREAPDNALAFAHRGLVQLRRAVRLLGDGHRAEAVRAVRGAIDDHDAVLKLHGRVAGAFVNRAVCRLLLDQILVADDVAAAVAARQAASLDLDEALKLAPESAAAHGNQGYLALRQAQALRAIGRPDRAAAVAAQALASLDRALQSLGEGPQAAWCRAQRDVAAALANGPR